MGLEFAGIFAKEGYDLLLVARREDRLLALKNELTQAFGIRVFVFAQDLSKAGAPEAVWAYAQEQNIPVDVLVNDAGFGDFGSFADCDREKQYAMIQVNVAALTMLTHLFLQPMLKRQRGRILNMASVAAFMPGGDMAVYYATKAYVLSFTEALSVELKGTGVTATALCPAPTNTGFADVCHLDESGIAKSFTKRSPARAARRGYKALMSGRVVTVTDRPYRFYLFWIRVVPRCAVRNILYRLQKEKKHKQ